MTMQILSIYVISWDMELVFLYYMKMKISVSLTMNIEIIL
jgi:hypothetical protein